MNFCKTLEIIHIDATRVKVFQQEVRLQRYMSVESF